MKIRKRIVAALAATLLAPVLVTVALEPAEAALPAPIILNAGTQNGADAQWAETQSLPEGGAGKTFYATFLVRHPADRTIPNVRIDNDYNGTDNTAGNGNIAVTAQRFVSASGGTQTSRVTVGIGIGNAPGTSCPTFGSPNRTPDGTIRMRVVDSTGELSAPVATNVRFVEDNNCIVTTGSNQDFPRLHTFSQNAEEVVPGQAITYSFACDDPDTDPIGTASDDECERQDIRWRRLNDGNTSGTTLVTGGDDNATRTFNMSFPTRGYYVVEARLGNRNGGFPRIDGASQGWWRLGNAVVNEPASTLTGSIAMSGVQPSSPPSVNPGTVVNATASVDDSAGVVQAIEWNADAHANATFERLEYQNASNSGGNVVAPEVSGAQLVQSVNTTAPGLKVVQARLSDNGAFDLADNHRRQTTVTAQLWVNALPTTTNVSATTAEDQAVTVSLSGSDSDSQPEPLRYLIVTPPNPAHGTLGPVTGNSVTFTPTADYFGPASFTYQVDDGQASTVGAHALSNVSTASITVSSVNDLPIVDPASATTDEDTPVDVQMVGDDVEDGSDLDYTVASQPTSGTASCTATGLCTYSPGLDFNGFDSFVVQGEDSDGGTTTATVSITVGAVNDAPVANAQTVTVPEDTVNFPINLTAGDVDDIVLSYTAPVDDVTNGTVTCFDNACTYTPVADYTGPDSFTFTVSDGELSDTETVTIDVSAINDAPVATDVLDAVTDEDVPVGVDATGTDIEGDPLTATAVTDPANGTAVVDDPDTVTYQGDLDFNGIDTFDFTIEDPDGLSDTGTVVVTVNAVNDAPVVADQSFTVLEDTPSFVSIAAGDVDGDLITWQVTSGPSNGTVFGSGPDVVYSPFLDVHGTDSFTVEISDGNGGTDTATISITVSPVNDQPVADLGAVTTNEDTAAPITLSASDPDGDAVTVTAPVAGPTSGTLVCAGVDCTYTPNGDFHGSDLFTFLVTDPSGATDSASVAVTVLSVNDAPAAADAAVTTDEDTAVAIALVATDVDGDLLTYSYGAPSQGTLEGSGPDAVYLPAPNSFGSDAFSFTVDDGNGGTDSGVVDVTVVAVNDAPLATGGSASTPEDTPVGFQLGGTDVEGDTLTYLVTDNPSGGSLLCDPSGACTYDPLANASGEYTLGYVVSDGALSSHGVFTVIVASDNDAPTASDSTVVTAEDTAAVITLVADDIEGDALSYAVVSPASSGAVVCSAGGSCTYTPNPNFNGTDSFLWEASDGQSAVQATVTVHVAAVNDAPQALDVAVSLPEDTPTAITLPATDVEGDAITFSVDLPASHGTVTTTSTGVVYTPAQDYVGTDLFTYRATDPSGAFTTGRVSITVDAVALIGTKIIAEPSLLNVKLGPGLLQVTLLPKLSARLVTTAGAPIAGQTLVFVLDGNPHTQCSAVTDANGRASCSASQVRTGLLSALTFGHVVNYAGSPDHAPATVKGPILQVGNLIKL